MLFSPNLLAWMKKPYNDTNISQIEVHNKKYLSQEHKLSYSYVQGVDAIKWAKFIPYVALNLNSVFFCADWQHWIAKMSAFMNTRIYICTYVSIFT